MSITLASPAFEDGAPIPARYTCDGEDLSPPLTWADPPRGTAAFALIADDPDAPAGTWVHWVVWNLAAASRGLPEGVPKTAELPGGGRQGRNDFRRLGYGGPCPPRGAPHRYFFRLYALESELTLREGTARPELERAMEGHVLASAELMGTYRRR